MKDHVAFKAAEDSRKLTLPQKPEDYPFEMPKDWKAPAGFDITLKPDDPLVPLYRQWALENGISKDSFTKGLGMLAAMKVSEAQHMKTLEAAQLQSLGANGSARVTAVHNWLAAQLGDGAKTFTEFPLVAAQVEGFEKIMQKFTTQGGTGPQSAHREMPEGDGKIPGYESMGFMQRRAAQDALAQRKKAS